MINKPAAFATAMLLMLTLICGAVAQPTPVPLPAGNNPPHPVCNTGPHPQVQIFTHAIYAELIWSFVPGVVRYHITRLDTTLPNQSPVILAPSLARNIQEFWDAVPDPRNSYQYSVSEMQADNCWGTTNITVSGTAFSLPNPEVAGAKRVMAADASSDNQVAWTDGQLMWAPTLGAIAYRIDGPGIGGEGLTLQAGHFIEGSAPVPGPYAPPLNPNNSDTSFWPEDANHSCHQCILAVPVHHVGLDASEYRITSIYPGNFADYYHQTKVIFGRLAECAIQSSPPNFAVGASQHITGSHLAFTEAVSFVLDATGQVVPLKSSVSSDTSIFIDTTPIDTTPLRNLQLPADGRFVIHTPPGNCMSDVSTVYSPKSKSPPSTPTSPPTPTTPPTPMVGSLSVSIGFTAGQGEMCQGQGIIRIQPQGAPADVRAQSQPVFFSGLAEQQNVGGSLTRGCVASYPFGNLTPGAWTVRAGYPNGASAACAATVINGQPSSTLVWDLRCF